MAGIINDFVSTIVAEILELFGGFLLNIFEQTLYPERFLGQIFNTTIMDRLTLFIYGVGISLLFLKFLRKGFMVYILWKEGDPDSSPQGMLMGSVLAIAISSTFPTLYGWMTEVTLWFGGRVLGYLHPTESDSWADAIHHVAGSLSGGGLIYVVLLLITCIHVILLIMQLLRRGVDLLVLRLGIPIATLGLVDSDDGIWKPYIKIFFQAMFTTVIQLFLLQLAFGIMTMRTTDIWALIWSLAIMQAAIKTPLLMQQLLVSTGSGGGVGQKVSTTVHLINSIKSFVK